jgi:diacylglycerol kinase family enzyme
MVLKRVALGKVKLGSGGGRMFLCMAGAGLDASIVLNLNPRWKAAMGKGAYWAAGFQSVGRRLEEFETRVDGESFRCGFALASRVRNYGGDLEIARGASLFRDDFEVVLFAGSNPLQYSKYLAGVMTGTLAGMSGVTVKRTQRVELAPLPETIVHMQIDGEYAGVVPATIEIVREGVTLLMPEEFRG